jgi:hypothetical protein
MDAMRYAVMGGEPVQSIRRIDLTEQLAEEDTMAGATVGGWLG